MPSPFFVIQFCFYFSVGFVVRQLGGSFAIFGFSVDLCEIANVPSIALA